MSSPKLLDCIILTFILFSIYLFSIYHKSKSILFKERQIFKCIENRTLENVFINQFIYESIDRIINF